MSHAANLRHKQRIPSPESLIPAKRRKVDHDKPNGTTLLVNGTTTVKKPKALLSRDVKHHSSRVQGTATAPFVSQPETWSMAAEVAQLGKDSTAVLQDATKSSSQESDAESQGEQHSDPDEAGGTHHRLGSELSIGSALELDQSVEPSFGDLLRIRNPDPVIVEPVSAAKAESRTVEAASATARTLSLPSATSLGTVLTQALKTNDVDLLESCLQVPSLDSIRATVQRLHPSLAATLLQRLAERLHKRPGRVGSLMIWVQWTVVSHGGYLVTQPAAMKEIHTLYQVVRQRATGLQPLLALKGRLDMLDAQLQMRRNIQNGLVSGSHAHQPKEMVVYVEGRDVDHSDEDAEGPTTTGALANSNQPNSREDRAPLEIPGSDEEDADMPVYLPNDDSLTGDEDEASNSDDEDNALIDDEAEETDDDTSEGLSEEIDYDDVDEADESSESQEADERPRKKSGAPRRRANGHL